MKKFLKYIISKLFKHKYIIFESVPDVGDNSKAVFDEMIVRGINQKYKLVWLLNGENKGYKEIPNVIYANKNDKKRKWYMILAKCYICCNGFIYSDNPDQKSFFLTHGMYVKKPTSYYTLPKEITYCLSSSKHLAKMQADALNVDVSKMVPLGFPRNDVLIKPTIDLKKIFGEEFKKIVVWYPTFRQHKTGMGTGSKYAIPIIWNEEAAKKLNECAKSHNLLIVLKPHFAQDTSKIKSLNLTNIRFIDDSFFINHNITSYQLIGSCDSLITDYSSVYFDYTLCDKPIGLVWEDFDEYKKNPGFALDMDYYMKGGVKIYNVDDFTSFINDVANDVDSFKTERQKIRDLSNYSQDTNNSKRVVDFIVKEARL